MLWDFQIAFFSSSAGAFFTYGIFIAIFSLISASISNAKKKASNLSVDGTEKNDNATLNEQAKEGV